jgi:aldose 1-epimerase
MNTDIILDQAQTTVRDRPRSGTQFTISHAGYSAVIASIGASVRTLQYDGRDLIVPFEADSLRPNYRGATLAPWPNRIVDGRYTHDGVEYRLPLNEPDRGHALHGLVCWLDFAAVHQTDRTVTLGSTIEPQDGYPFRLALEVTFTISEHGLSTTVLATNLGSERAPFGTGPHPYLVAGPGRVDDWTLQLPASEVMTVTEDRLTPAGIERVETESNGAYDFRTPRPIAETAIDHAFTALARDGSATTTVRLLDPSGSGVAMTWGTDCPWVQIHTADLPDPAKSRLGLAVEPMTCPPDAFNSTIDLISIRPGETTQASWSISAL